jgi:predicted transcriptional regulator
MKDSNGLSNRRRIYQFILDNPGTYLRELQRELDLQVGVLQHHLNAMCADGLLRFEDDGYRKRYFITGSQTSEERKMLALIRLRTPRRMIIHLLRNGRATSQELREELGITKGAVSFQVSRLVSKGILTERVEGRHKVYAVADPACAARLLITYRRTFLDSLVDSFIESWRGLR